MRSGPSAKELAGATDPGQRRASGMVRRFGVASTSKVIWRLTGVRGLETTEQVDAEVFAGIGIYARPGANGKPEAIVVNVGDARHPVIIATRDEAAAHAIRGDLGANKPAAGETLIFASVGGAVVYLRNNGTVEVRTAAGTAGALATKEEVKALRDYLNALTYGGSGSIAPVGMPNISGTTVLKGE